jgi:hypothetical protein
MGVAVEYLPIKRDLAAEGRIEAGWIDAHRIGQRRHAHPFISMRMKQGLRLIQGDITIESAGATTAARFFFNGHYKNP